MPEYQARANPGPILLIVGPWGSTVTYRPGFVVTSGGTAYVCLKTHKNITPGTDGTAWTGISTGATGPTGDTGAAGTTPGLSDIGALLTTAGITASSTLPQVLAAFGIS